MTNHTPTPWKIKDKASFKSTRVGIDGTDIATVWTNDAAYIVRAVNMHEELLKVCREAYDLFASKESLGAEAVEVWGHLEQAIAKAEGK